MKTYKEQIEDLICSCCEEKTSGKQWHDQPKGKGLCSGCFDMLLDDDGISKVEKEFGYYGINYCVGKK